MIPKLIVGLLLISATGFDSHNPWITLKDRTWRCEQFTGSQVIFYESVNGLRKAILQVYGSGIPLVSSTIFDVEIDGVEVILKNGLDLKGNNEQVMDPIKVILTEDSDLVIDDRMYRQKYDYIGALNWQSEIGGLDSLDIELLRSIPIGKQAIYEPKCFFN